MRSAGGQCEARAGSAKRGRGLQASAASAPAARVSRSVASEYLASGAVLAVPAVRVAAPAVRVAAPALRVAAPAVLRLQM